MFTQFHAATLHTRYRTRYCTRYRSGVQRSGSTRTLKLRASSRGELLQRSMPQRSMQQRQRSMHQKLMPQQFMPQWSMQQWSMLQRSMLQRLMPQRSMHKKSMPQQLRCCRAAASRSDGRHGDEPSTVCVQSDPGSSCPDVGWPRWMPPKVLKPLQAISVER